MWAIRDSRALNAQEKALLWAVESRGIHYGSWETVASDAGMKRDAYYKWRKSLQDKGVLSVTERPGKTTVHEVDAEWFALDATAGNTNEPSGNLALTQTVETNNRSGNLVMKEDHEGDPRKGSPKNDHKVKRLGGKTYLRMVRTEEMNAWDRIELDERLQTMTEQERADWHALIEAEAYLP